MRIRMHTSIHSHTYTNVTHTEYAAPYAPDSECIRWFWAMFTDWESEMRRKFVK